MTQTKDSLIRTVRLVRCLNKETEVLLRRLGEVATALNAVKTAFEKLPFEESDLADLARQANRLSDCLAGAAETYQADDFPDVNALHELASESQTLVASMAAASEAE